MKYNKARLVKQTEDRIKALQKDLATDQGKIKSDWDGFKAGLIADAKIYLQQLQDWKPFGQSQGQLPIQPPRLNNRYIPNTSSGYHVSAAQQVRQLKQFLKHLELADGDTIDFKNNYDIQLLNIIVGGK